MHPKMFVVPDYERRENEKDQFVRTAATLNEQITVKKTKKLGEAFKNRESHNAQIAKIIDELDHHEMDDK